MKEIIYQEVGTVYRFILGWRHASLAGYLFIVAATISLTLNAYSQESDLAFVIPLFASPLGIIFWIIDVRNRDLYHAAITAGKGLEGEYGGFFTTVLDNVALSRNRSVFTKATHSGALNVLFFLTSGGLLILSSFLLFDGYSGTEKVEVGSGNVLEISSSRDIE